MGGTRQDRTRTNRHETAQDRDERSKQTDNRGEERRGTAGRGTRRAEGTKRRGRREAESRRRRGEARNFTDGMTRHRPAITKTRTGGQGATSQPNPTDEMEAESKHAVGNARDREHKPPRHPISKTGRKARRQERTGPDAGEQDPTANRGSKASQEDENPNRRRDNSERAQARERHDTMRSKQIAIPPAAADRPPVRTSHARGRGINWNPQARENPHEGEGRKERRKRGKNMTLG